jgi:hypothetical protein
MGIIPANQLDPASPDYRIPANELDPASPNYRTPASRLDPSSPGYRIPAGELDPASPGYRIPADQRADAGLQFAHPDYANGYQLVSLLHPSGETHQVAIPNGMDLADVAANNPEYHHSSAPSGEGFYFHSDGSIFHL